MWSDNETTVDALNVQHVVGAIVNVIRNEALTPVTIGVFGPWGSGKSSVAQMVRQELSTSSGANADTLTVYFNGWRFEGYEDAKAALAAAILEALEKRVRGVPALWEKTKSAFSEMWERVNWLRVGKLGLEAGLALKTGGLSLLVTRGTRLLHPTTKEEAATKENGEQHEELASILKERETEDRAVHTTVRDFDEAFKKLLELTEVQRLVVIIDDLDRCLPDRVIETLEAIRLFLSVPRAAFVISADEVLIQHAVAQRFPEMDELQMNVGRDYLQKMIQVPVRVPPLAPQDIEQYVALLFAQRNLSASEFSALCDKVRRAMTTAAREGGGMFDKATFSAATAATYLTEEASARLREDLALAAQTAPVLALSAQGNPRLVKRFLNALVLRLTMANARGVTLRRDVAAKLLLLEYFATELFESLAASQAHQGGFPAELAQLEREARAEPSSDISEPAAIEGVEADSAESDTGRRETATRGALGPRGHGATTADLASARESDPEPVGAGKRRRAENVGSGNAGGSSSSENKSGAVSRQGQGDSGLPAWALAARTDPWLRTWLASEPALESVDLRPYVYFARERIALLPSATARLSPLGLETVRTFLAGGQSAHQAGAARARTLPRPDVFAVFSDLADRVRRSSKSFTEDSLLDALIALTEARPELLVKLVSVLASLSVALLEPRVASRLLNMARSIEQAGVTVRPALASVLDAWAAQSANPTLAAGARQALQRLHQGPAKNFGNRPRG